jgi:hypothetical protein
LKIRQTRTRTVGQAISQSVKKRVGGATFKSAYFKHCAH